MKKVMITVIAMFLLICWPLGGLWGAMLSPQIPLLRGYLSSAA